MSQPSNGWLRKVGVLISPNSLSGGERLKLGLLMVLAQQPDLLLLDEPDNHLDHAFGLPQTAYSGAGRLPRHFDACLPRSRVCGGGED